MSTEHRQYSMHNQADKIQSPNRDQIKPPTSSYSLMRTNQRKMVLKAEHAHQWLLLVVQGLKNCSLIDMEEAVQQAEAAQLS